MKTDDDPTLAHDYMFEVYERLCRRRDIRARRELVAWSILFVFTALIGVAAIKAVDILTDPEINGTYHWSVSDLR